MIIHRLPLKPLAQLRLVSNHWNSLISDPRLCSLRNRAAIGLIFERDWTRSKHIFTKHIRLYDGDVAEKPSPAQIVASIDDLLLEIYHLLPMKPLAQLKLVSKYWNSLISGPLRNRAAVGLIFEGGLGTRQTIFLNKSITSQPILNMTPITNGPCYRDYKIVHSCNGLLLCLTSNRRDGPKYYVYNPTTSKYITLPLPQVEIYRSRVSICGMYLAFDPSKSPHYRVVCVLRSRSDWLNMFEFYSSKTGSWRKGGVLVKPAVNFDFENGVYWNGAIHWVNIITKPRECVYFSIDCNQTPKVFPNPPLQDDKSYEISDYYFGESCDHLHFVDAHRELDEFNVYEMKRDYSEWFVKYKVSVSEIRRDYSEWFINRKLDASNVIMNRILSFLKNKVCVRVYAVVRGKNDEDSFLVIETGKIATATKGLRIARYNIEQKTCETLGDCDFDLTYCSRHAFQYIESICSV
ncbi:hypothetical protein CASFOL_006802 [Castilleja foliolosa]|uniref:F-box domain-containing protein n=1 Tax=Castilleja foliolosa TaxID=1961234 RepID=A0ABD3E8C2_9LAMI